MSLSGLSEVAQWPGYHQNYIWSSRYLCALQVLDRSTLWLFNIAMDNGPFIDDFPIKTTIYRGFSMAMLNNQRVITLNFSMGQFCMFCCIELSALCSVYRPRAPLQFCYSPRKVRSRVALDQIVIPSNGVNPTMNLRAFVGRPGPEPVAELGFCFTTPKMIINIINFCINGW